MKTEQILSEGLKRGFRVVLPAHDITPKVEQRLKEIAKKVRLDGFRPGKAPLQVIRQHYASAAFGDIVENVVLEANDKLFKDEKIRPAYRPSITLEKANPDQDLEYVMEFEVVPAITLTDFSSIKIDKPIAPIADEEINKGLQRLAESNRKFVPITTPRPSQNGDSVLLDFLGMIDGEPFEGGKGKNYPLTIGSNTFIPGFEKQVSGHNVGEEFIVKVEFPKDYGSKILAGKKAEFQCIIQEIREAVVPPVDDALAKSVGQADLAALRDVMQREMQKNYTQQTRYKMKRQLLDILADKHQFEVPAKLLEREFAGIWQNIQDMKAKGHLSPTEAKKPEVELEAEYRDIAQRRVRLGLLFGEIGEQNNIQVTQAELRAAVIAEARRYPGQEKMIVEYYEKNPAALTTLTSSILEEKVVDHLLTLVQVVEKTVTVDDLFTEPDYVAA